ncbi:oligopeptide ABC transporter permease [Bacillota bacterium Meth-B3]
MVQLKKYKVESQLGVIFRRLRKNKMAVISLLILTAIVLTSIIVPMASPYHFNNNQMGKKYKAPSAEHWLGTDENGRDVFVRLFYGGRISLVIALLVVLVEVVLGVVVGAVAGFYGGRLDNFLMRLCELFLSLPFMMVAITIIAVFGSPDKVKFPALAQYVAAIGMDNWKIFLLVMVLGGLSWPSMARIVRGQVLSIREQEYMEACEALGISDRSRIFKHILPNVMSSVIVYATLGIASVILTETALSFLGLGVDPVTPTWGSLIQSARDVSNIKKRLWLWMPAGGMIFLTVMCFNLLGDGLRDALDPKSKE